MGGERNYLKGGIVNKHKGYTLRCWTKFEVNIESNSRSICALIMQGGLKVAIFWLSRCCFKVGTLLRTDLCDSLISRFYIVVRI